MPPISLSKSAMSRRFVPYIFLPLLALHTFEASAAAPVGRGLVEKEVLPRESLRGYGPVSGVLWSGGGGGSILEIVCADAGKAKLTQSKYLSDLGVLPGVKDVPLDVGRTTVSAREVEGQGWVAALRKGRHVFIAAAPGKEEFLGILNRLPGAPIAACSSKQEVEVPMWLDRWDRFGFRFYYRPWEVPPGTPPAKYDTTKEFDFAGQHDRSGLVVWANRNDVDTAEGMTNDVWWDWMQAAAERKHLPVGLNIMVGGIGSSWLYNRYRSQTAQRMPQYCGGFYTVADAHHGGSGIFSWNSTSAKDVELGELQAIVRRMVAQPNLTSVLEPHGELRHGWHDLFMDYGPVADAGYGRFLKEKYKTLAALNDRWGATYSSWSEIRVPELASFLGWGEQALDLTGDWRINHESFPAGKDPKVDKTAKSIAAPPEWYEEGFDDSGWAVASAPGTDRTMFLPKRPAVYRRTINVSAEWLAKNPNVWLYLWDLNLATGDTVKVAVNGTIIGESTLKNAVSHWGALNVSKALRPGANQISLRLPKGYLAYRVYLSPDEPLQYPALGRERNARWVDFIDWMSWSRVGMARRGMEMIRQAAPNQPITLMAPDSYVDGIKQLAKSYGGNFHNTGYMAAFWADYLPSVMRGARLPFSLEPGGPAKDLPDFKKAMGLWATEGIQGIDYFIHIGDVMWNPEIRKHFEDNLTEIKSVGKYHAPPAEVAALYSTNSTGYAAYPWGQNANTNLAGGYWSWNVRAYLKDRYESDGLTESSFADGDAARYKVIIDTNTSIMDEAALAAIEKYVSGGGTFVTFVQTGRHTPTEPDSWPISRLTGFRVTQIDPLTAEGNPTQTRSLKAAPDQDVFTGDWTKAAANGLTLEKTAPDAQPLLLWEDGSIAAGMRKIGKGTIVQIGCKFTGPKIGDRVEPSSSKPSAREETKADSSTALKDLLAQLLHWKHIAPVAATWEPENTYIMLRHYLSNNGLYDVWTAWNQSPKASAQGSIALKPDQNPAFAIALRDGQQVTVKDRRIAVDLEPLETRIFLTPRNALATAPLAWFELQRDWWRACAQPSAKKLPEPTHRFSVDLEKDWAFKPLTGTDVVADLIGPGVDDTQWEKVSMGIWSLPDKTDIRHALLRKTFQVPPEWKEGEPSLWLQSFFNTTFMDKGRIWLDGNLISNWSPNGLVDANPKGTLQPGTSHTLAVEIESQGSLAGSRGTAWLWFWPKPASSLDLAGDWVPSSDVLFDKAPIKLPGPYSARTLRRDIEVPASEAGKNVVLRADVTGALAGVLVNGHWVRRLHHIIGTRFDLNVTPWVRFGQNNTIELVSMNEPTQGQVKTVRLDFHQPENYP